MATSTTAAAATSVVGVQRTRTYNDAIDALNSLQTPYAIIEARRKAGIRPDATSIAEMRTHQGQGQHLRLRRVDSAAIPDLPGVPRKIGLFTSPHLIAVRERIRIDGKPVSEELFARYFFEVWDMLGQAEEAEGNSTNEGKPVASSENVLDVPMPTRPIYARYLTLMSYHLFLQEGVDVAVYETGIGGEYDATNIVERPVATAISTLGIDHVFALGNTVEKIAWHKAGIMKKGSAAFTIEQVPEAAEVLQNRAEQKRGRYEGLGH
ncbi:folylpolyglutamate synthase [Apiospora arundinis]